MNGNDFFRPLWLRLAIVAACAGWVALEYLHGQVGWAVIAAAATVWSLLLTYRPGGS